MRRHETDWFSLVVGVLAVGIGGGYLLGQAYGLDTDVASVLPLVLIAAGLLGAIATAGQALRRRRTQQEPSP